MDPASQLMTSVERISYYDVDRKAGEGGLLHDACEGVYFSRHDPDPLVVLITRFVSTDRAVGAMLDDEVTGYEFVVSDSGLSMESSTRTTERADGFSLSYHVLDCLLVHVTWIDSEISPSERDELVRASVLAPERYCP